MYQKHLWLKFQFQSTRPRWGATQSVSGPTFQQKISIHTPQVGRDCENPRADLVIHNFNPHAPGGARRWMQDGVLSGQIFQSTRPRWGATRSNLGGAHARVISIHTPQVGRDVRRMIYNSIKKDFNPHAPGGARPATDLERLDELRISIHTPQVGRDKFMAEILQGRTAISIHTPQVGRDAENRRIITTRKISIHTPQVGRDDCIIGGSPCQDLFQSTRPRWGATKDTRYTA